MSQKVTLQEIGPVSLWVTVYMLIADGSTVPAMPDQVMLWIRGTSPSGSVVVPMQLRVLPGTTVLELDPIATTGAAGGRLATVMVFCNISERKPALFTSCATQVRDLPRIEASISKILVRVTVSPARPQRTVRPLGS